MKGIVNLPAVLPAQNWTKRPDKGSVRPIGELQLAKPIAPQLRCGLHPEWRYRQQHIADSVAAANAYERIAKGNALINPLIDILA